MRVWSVYFCRPGYQYPGKKEVTARVTMFDGTIREFKFSEDANDTTILIQLRRMLTAKKKKKTKGDEASW